MMRRSLDDKLGLRVEPVDDIDGDVIAPLRERRVATAGDGTAIGDREIRLRHATGGEGGA